MTDKDRESRRGHSIGWAQHDLGDRLRPPSGRRPGPGMPINLDVTRQGMRQINSNIAKLRRIVDQLTPERQKKES